MQLIDKTVHGDIINFDIPYKSIQGRITQEKYFDVRGEGHFIDGYFLFAIPKICSTTLNMSAPTERYNRYYKSIIILRDPIDRWITGIMEFLSKYHLDEDLFFNETIYEVAFDRHTAQQNWYIPGNVNYGNTFFEKYNRKILEEIKEKYNLPNLITHTYNDSTRLEKTYFKNKIHKALENPDLENKIKTYYKNDYKLIERFTNEQRLEYINRNPR